MKRLSISFLVLAMFAAFPAPAQRPAELDKAFLDLVSYEAGDDSAALESIDAWVVASHGAPETRKELEKRLVQILRIDNSTQAAKQFAAKQLYRIGTEESVRELRSLLLKQSTSDLARYVLERLPGGAAQDALLWALKKTRGSVRVGIINSLGERGEAGAVRRLRNLSGNGDPRVMRAAIVAMGKIGGPDAAKAVLWCTRNVRYDLRPVAALAYLKCADKILEAGETDTAIGMYDAFFIEAESKNVRLAALRGLIKAEGEYAARTILEVMSGDDPDLFAVAASAVRDARGPAATRALVKALPSLRPEAQVMVIGALAEREADTVRPAILTAARHPDAAVRVASVEALGSVGDLASLSVLLNAAVRLTGLEQETARRSIARLDAPGVDDALVRAAMSADNAVRGEAIRTLGARRTKHAGQVLVRVLRRDVEVLRFEALKALAHVAREQDLPAIVEALVETPSEEMRREAERTLLAAMEDMAEGPARTEALVAALAQGAQEEARAALFRILGKIGDDSALPALRNAARERDSQIRGAAIQALAAWPGPGALEDLEKLLKRADDDAERRTLFDGFIRLLRMPSERSTEDTLNYFGRAADHAASTDERRKVLAGLAQLRDPKAADIVEKLAADPELLEEANLARELILGGAG